MSPASVRQKWRRSLTDRLLVSKQIVLVDMCSFQPWEKDKKDCQCGEKDVETGLVQFFLETDIQLSSFKLKTPLCLGSLISNQHILTTKYCFGEDQLDERKGEKTYLALMKYEQTVEYLNLHLH